jgi:hypothetical protein
MTAAFHQYACLLFNLFNAVVVIALFEPPIGNTRLGKLLDLLDREEFPESAKTPGLGEKAN